MAQLAETRAAPGGTPAAVTNGGFALDNVADFMQLYPGTKQIDIIPRNYSTAVVVRFALNPWLAVLRVDSATSGAPKVVDYSEAAQDGSASTSVDLSSLDGTTGMLLLGSHLPFRGVNIDVDGANGTASIITSTSFYSTKGGWKALTVTDGTASGGATLAVDGNITWTPPADWVPIRIEELLAGMPGMRYKGAPLYWVQVRPASGLDSATTLDHVLSMNRSTVYAELPSGVAVMGLEVERDLGGVGCIEALVDAGSASLIVNCTAGRFS